MNAECLPFSSTSLGASPDGTRSLLHILTQHCPAGKAAGLSPSAVATAARNQDVCFRRRDWTQASIRKKIEAELPHTVIVIPGETDDSGGCNEDLKCHSSNNAPIISRSGNPHTAPNAILWKIFRSTLGDQLYEVTTTNTVKPIAKLTQSYGPFARITANTDATVAAASAA